MIILAHRANLTGPDPKKENSPAACARALAEGFGLETDLRRDPSGALYISHDAHPHTAQNALEIYSELFRKYPAAELAINVKELGHEQELVELVNSGRLGARSFYFDFELLEKHSPGTAQRKIKSLPDSANVRLASRLSDRGETMAQCLNIPSDVVWGDEFDALWLTQEDVKQVQQAGRKLYMISPELHGFHLITMRHRWRDFKDWGVDGVCTDHSLEARKFFG